MNTAGRILAVSDRTPKERRDMAEFYAASFEWDRGLVTYRYDDGSALMMVLDDGLSPTEIIEVAA